MSSSRTRFGVAIILADLGVLSSSIPPGEAFTPLLPNMFISAEVIGAVTRLGALVGPIEKSGDGSRDRPNFGASSEEGRADALSPSGCKMFESAIVVVVASLALLSKEEKI